MVLPLAERLWIEEESASRDKQHLTRHDSRHFEIRDSLFLSFELQGRTDHGVRCSIIDEEEEVEDAQHANPIKRCIQSGPQQQHPSRFPQKRAKKGESSMGNLSLGKVKIMRDFCPIFPNQMLH